VERTRVCSLEGVLLVQISLPVKRGEDLRNKDEILGDWRQVLRPARGSLPLRESQHQRHRKLSTALLSYNSRHEVAEESGRTTGNGRIWRARGGQMSMSIQEEIGQGRALPEGTGFSKSKPALVFHEKWTVKKETICKTGPGCKGVCYGKNKIVQFIPYKATKQAGR